MLNFNALITSLAIGVLILLRVFDKTIKIKPSLFLLIPFFALLLLQSIIANDIFFSSSGGVVLFAICLAYMLGEIHGELTSIVARQEWVSTEINEKKLRFLILTSSVASLCGVLLYYKALGGDIASPIDFILSAGKVREMLNSGQLEVNYVSKIGFLMVYSTVVIALTYYVIFGWNKFLVLPFISLVLINLSQVARAGLLIAILQCIVAIYLRYKDAGLVLWEKLLPMLVLPIPIFICVHLLRYGLVDFDLNVFEAIINSNRGYFFGGLSAFSYYVDMQMSHNDLTLGRYTFSGLFAALGLAPQALGIYDEYAQISPLGEVANIYTAYRSFIEDFSIWISLCLYFALGKILVGMSVKFIYGRAEYAAIIIPMFSFLMFSPVASLTYCNSFLLSCFLPCVLIKTLCTKSVFNK